MENTSGNNLDNPEKSTSLEITLIDNADNQFKVYVSVPIVRMDDQQDDFSFVDKGTIRSLSC